MAIKVSSVYSFPISKAHQIINKMWCSC